MKNKLKAFSPLLLLYLMFHPGTVKAGNTPDTISKRTSKSYKVFKNDRLIIDNQYGDVEVKTWDKKEVLINITVSSHLKTIQTTKPANRVHVISKRNNNEIRCITLIDTPAVQGMIGELPKTNSTIKYQIYTPADLPLKIKNRFGNIKISDYSGTLDIDEKFGNITTGNILAAGKFHVEQGSINIPYLRAGELSATGFDHIKIGKISGKLSGGFSSGNLVDLELTAATDSLMIKADNIRQIDLHGMNSTSANYKINAILSKVINRSALPLKETAMGETLKHPGQTIASQQPVVKQNDSTSGSNAPDQIISEKKKMLELKILKKTKVFEGGDPNSKTKIRIGVAFSVLNIDN